MLCCFSSQLIEDCCYLLWTGNIFSFLEKLRMYKRHPHGHGGDKEHYKPAGNGKVWGQHLEGRSHQILPSVMPKWISPRSIWLGTPHFRAKFPKKWKPKLQLVDQRCAAHCSHSVVALADFPGILLQDGGSSTPSPFTSHLVLNPQAPAFPRNSDGAAPWGMSVCPRGCSRCQSWNSQDFLCRLRFVLPTTAQGQAGRKRSQAGRESWEFVYPKAMAVNWLQLFLKIFLGFDHSSRRQQEKHRWNPTPLKRNPSS